MIKQFVLMMSSMPRSHIFGCPTSFSFLLNSVRSKKWEMTERFFSDLSTFWHRFLTSITPVQLHLSTFGYEREKFFMDGRPIPVSLVSYKCTMSTSVASHYHLFIWHMGFFRTEIWLIFFTIDGLYRWSFSLFLVYF